MRATMQCIIMHSVEVWTTIASRTNTLFEVYCLRTLTSSPSTFRSNDRLFLCFHGTQNVRELRSFHSRLVTLPSCNSWSKNPTICGFCMTFRPGIFKWSYTMMLTHVVRLLNRQLVKRQYSTIGYRERRVSQQRLACSIGLYIAYR